MNTITTKAYGAYDKEEIVNIYASVGWINYTNNTDMLEQAYKHSLYILGAYEGDELVGIIRVVGDGHSIIYIQDIIVHPSHQRKGIGSLLLNKVLERYKDVYQKILMTMNEEKTVKFYESLGFIADYDIGCVAFGIYNA